MIRPCLAAIVIAALVAPLAHAQPPDNGDGRFSFHRADDGYLRLDGKTGQVSICGRRGTGWQCHLVPDERSALETEIARLQADNAALKKELLARNLPLPGGMRPESPASTPSRKGPQISDEEINRMMDVFEKVWRRLVDMITSVQQDLRKRI
jgi:hypothetical protein